MPHDWIVDLAAPCLHVHRLTADGYALVLSAGPDERVRAEPFDAIELEVGSLFGRA